MAGRKKIGNLELVNEGEIDREVYTWALQVRGRAYLDWTTMMLAAREDHDELVAATKRFKGHGYECRTVLEQPRIRTKLKKGPTP